jgi:hypothetical protein
MVPAKTMLVLLLIEAVESAIVSAVLETVTLSPVRLPSSVLNVFVFKETFKSRSKIIMY